MSQKNVEIVQRFEDCWTRRDLDAALECVHTDFEFDWSESMGPFVGTYSGHDGLTRFWTDLLEAWEYFSRTTVEVIDVGPDGGPCCGPCETRAAYRSHLRTRTS